MEQEAPKPELSKREAREARREQKAFRSQAMKVLWVVLGVAAVAGITWLTVSGKQENAAVANELLVVASDDYVVGPENAPATLIEYLDFECEACGAYFPLVKQLEEELPNDVRVVRRYFPLPGHRNGLPAALAVEAAARQGKYNEMHDLLFTEQKNWGEKSAPTPQAFEAYAQQLGLDMEKFKADVASQSVKDRVQRDIDAGTKLGNRGTPSFFLNGKKLENPQSYEAFKKAIQDAAAANR